MLRLAGTNRGQELGGGRLEPKRSTKSPSLGVLAADRLELPLRELRGQPSGNSSLHDHAPALVFDAFHLARLMEQRDQCPLGIWQANEDRSVSLVQFLLHEFEKLR